MDQAKVNYAFAATFADQLAATGVRHVCLAPGSRSAALAMAFARHPALKTWVQVDERSCSFFALGLAKSTGAPVALLCTSGTAAAEFHAAVVEADLSRTPLIVLTADRPPELVGVGANQAIDQARLYGTAVRWFHDPGAPESVDGTRWRRLAVRAVAEATGPPAGPVHLNLPFREPLFPAPGELPQAVPGRVASVGRPGMVAELGPVVEAVEKASRPVVVAGQLAPSASARAAAEALRLPLLAEPTSGLRVRAAAYDALLRDAAWAADNRPDVVVRLGAVPTSKPLNQWLAGAERTFLVDPAGWRDPDLAATDLVRAEPDAALAALASAVAPAGWAAEWARAAAAAERALDAALEGLPLFEAHAVRALAQALPDRVNVMVGSSMPIRDVDTFWPATAPGQRLWGNRGASGIDGLVSTGLGVAAAEPEVPAVLLLGDLSLYHDMNGLWAIRRHGLRATVVVLDNDGGGIFSFLPQAAHADVFEEVFGTPLGLRMEDVARLYGLDFVAVDGAPRLERALGEALASRGSTLVAVRFARPASVEGHRACWAAVSREVHPPVRGA